VARRLLIVDDDARFRELLRMVLESAPEFEVVGEADEGASAMEAARELSPDLVLLDVNLPDTTGFELAPRLAAEAGDPDVVIISSRGDETYQELARKAGATAFLPKDELSAAAISSVLA
jgi:DNA-binding NarL/FixJ family response regulator